MGLQCSDIEVRIIDTTTLFRIFGPIGTSLSSVEKWIFSVLYSIESVSG